MTKDEFSKLKEFDIVTATNFRPPKVVVFRAFMYGDVKYGAVADGTGVPLTRQCTELLRTANSICSNCLMLSTCNREDHILKCYRLKEELLCQ